MNFADFDLPHWMSLSAMTLFIVMFTLIVIGLTVQLSRKSVHMITRAAFTLCICLSAITAFLYYWHHRLR